jgi:hypothetical protein
MRIDAHRNDKGRQSRPLSFDQKNGYAQPLVVPQFAHL